MKISKNHMTIRISWGLSETKQLKGTNLTLETMKTLSELVCSFFNKNNYLQYLHYV